MVSSYPRHRAAAAKPPFGKNANCIDYSNKDEHKVSPYKQKTNSILYNAINNVIKYTVNSTKEAHHAAHIRKRLEDKRNIRH